MSNPTRDPELGTMTSPASSPRPLRVTDLPTEILHQVFSHFADARMGRPGRVDWFWNEPYPDLEAKRAAIYSARLACRRLHDIASPLLLPTVRVKLEQASLDRLDEISRIPHVAAGVRGFEVILAYRPEEFAGDFGRFIEHREGDLIHGDKFKRLNEEEWTKGYGVYGTLLYEPYLEYRRRHREQKDLITTGAFVDAVTAAASRMPLFGSILFDDSDIYAGHLSVRERDSLFLPLLMTAADGWAELDDRRAAVPPARILADLPVALHRAGVPLRELGVQCFSSTATVEDDPLVQDLDALREACAQLEEVTFWPFGRWVEWTDEGARQLNAYLGALLSGHSLELVHIYTSGFQSRQGFGKMPVGAALARIDGSRVKGVTVEGASFTSEEMARLREGLGERVDAVLTLWGVEVVGEGGV